MGDNLVGSWKNFKILLGGSGWVTHKVAVATLAKPFNDLFFFSEADDFKKAIKRIAGAAPTFRLFLGPFVDKGK